MRAICVDDEKILMDHTVSMCSELPQIDEVRGFTKPKEALQWLEDNTADLALLDIDMPTMNGIELAMRIKEKSPDTAIIFITGYSHYAVDAFQVRASGWCVRSEILTCLLTVNLSDSRWQDARNSLLIWLTGTAEM